MFVYSAKYVRMLCSLTAATFLTAAKWNLFHKQLCISWQQGMSHSLFLAQSLFVSLIWEDVPPPTAELKWLRNFPVSKSVQPSLNQSQVGSLRGQKLHWVSPFSLQQLVNMCTGKCSLFIGVALYPLALISIICNIVLFFPAGDVQYAKDGHITEEVKYMGGLIGGGVMVSSFILTIGHNITLNWLFT